MTLEKLKSLIAKAELKYKLSPRTRVKIFTEGVVSDDGTSYYATATDVKEVNVGTYSSPEGHDAIELQITNFSTKPKKRN